MKRITVSILAMLVMAVVYSQSIAYTFYYDEVWIDGRGEPDGKPGVGKVVIYDNLDVVFEGRSTAFGNFKPSFKIQSASTSLDIFLTIKSSSDENCEQIILGSNGVIAIYSDKRNPNNEIKYSLSSNDTERNSLTMESMMSAFKNRKGIFSTFRSEADLELPLKIEGYASNYRVTSRAGGDEIAYSVRTKTGKMIDETVFEDFDVSSDAYWADVSFHTEAAFLLKTEPNTTGSTRTATITVTPHKSDIKTYMTVTQPSMVAKVNRVWVEHNKFKGLMKGMKIHVEFETFNVRGIQGNCNAYFSFSNGNKLFDYNGNYRAVDGQVCCPGYFTSGYDNTIYTDFELFMPYSELHISGSADCYFIVEVQVAGQSAASEKISFSFY